MKNKSISLVVVFILLSSSIPFVSSYEITSNNSIYVDDNIDDSWQQNIQAIKNEVIGEPILFNNTRISDNSGNDYHPSLTTKIQEYPIIVGMIITLV